MTMKRIRIAAAGTLTTALLLPLIPATAHAAGDTTYDAARDAVYAAAYRTQLAAQWGFQSTMDYYETNSDGELTIEESTAAWVDNESFGERAAAMRHTFYYGPGDTRTYRYGSIERFRAGGYRAWSALPEASEGNRADQQVMKQLPAYARYATGTPPVNDTDRFTPNSVTRNLTEAEQVPWAVDSAIDSCDYTYSNATVDCSVNITGEGQARTWTFTIVKTTPEQGSNTTTVQLRTDDNGHLNYQQVDESETASWSASRTVSTARVTGDEGIDVPTPRLKGTSVPSETATRAAATQAVNQLAKKYRSTITQVLTQAGKPLTQANLLWAHKKLSADDPKWWYIDANDWIGFSGIGWTELATHVDATASDYLTTTKATIEFRVQNGKLTSRLVVD